MQTEKNKAKRQRERLRCGGTADPRQVCGSVSSGETWQLHILRQVGWNWTMRQHLVASLVLRRSTSSSHLYPWQFLHVKIQVYIYKPLWDAGFIKKKIYQLIAVFYASYCSHFPHVWLLCTLTLAGWNDTKAVRCLRMKTGSCPKCRRVETWVFIINEARGEMSTNS